MALPEPPVNVKLILTDNRIIPVDTIYQGIYNGIHQWSVVNAPPPQTVKGIKIDKLPEQTEVTLVARATE